MNRRAFINWSSTLTAGLILLGAWGCHTAHPRDGRQTLRVLTYNIHHGEGVDGRLDLERIASLITEHRPDLVALQEVDRGVARTQGRNLPAELARMTGMQVVFGKNIDHQGGDYGNAILSRHPVASSTNLHYRMLRDGEQRGLLAATIDFYRTPVVFMATHLDFRPDPAERLSNVGEIQAMAARHTGSLVIVAGDFNDHPGGEVHQAMKAVFLDAWEASGGGDGFTYSSTSPKSRIDYVYVQPQAKWRVVCSEVLASQASDHLPLLVELARSVPE